MKRIKNEKADVFVMENFLTKEECDKVVEYIDSHSTRSTISGGGSDKVRVSKVRTSSTASLRPQQFPLIKNIDKRISRTIGVPLELGEINQGQKYEVGQEFRDHCDFFGGKNQRHIQKMGNRTHTFMIYLNDDCEGGETEFKRLGIKFKPKKGMAVMWVNKRNGKNNQNTLHAGRPVTKGVKYIITKWFREKPTGAYPLSKYFKDTYPDLMTDKPRTDFTSNTRTPSKAVDTSKNTKYFTSHKDFPKFTEVGFELRDLPEDIWAYIQETYEVLKPRKRTEKFPGQMKIIYDKDKKNSPVDIMSLALVKDRRNKIHQMLHPILTEWSGQNIEPSMMYGIRSYKEGAILVDHVDRLKTHHVSCIVIVDEKSNKPWPLDIQSHDGKWHKVYAKPGQFILYESCACMHGRLEEFDGEYFRNFFVHYKLKDWDFRPELAKK